jgi:hypothetical protein
MNGALPDMRIATQLPIIVSGLLAVAACGSRSSPIEPSPSALPFRAGAHIVRFGGADLIGLGPGPSTPGCPGIGVARFGNVATEVSLDQVGSEWRARPSTPAGGMFEMRFVPGTAQPDGSPREVVVSGTASGLVINTASDLFPGGDSHVTLGGGSLGPTISLSGTMLPTGVAAGGLIKGNVVFGNSRGASIGCNSGTVMWEISRLSGP